MSISDNYVPVKQSGNGVTVDFSGNWNVIAASYIRVYWEDKTTGIQTLKTLDTHYTLDFDESGFTVTFDALYIPPSTVWVVIGRAVAQDQVVPYKTSQGFQGAVQENSFDKLTAMSQDVEESINRSLKFQLGSSAIGALPEPSAGELLAWGDDEDGEVVNVSILDFPEGTEIITTGLATNDALVWGGTTWINKSIANLVALFGAAISALQSLTPAANKMAYYTSASAAAMTDLSAFGRSIIASASAAALFAILGIKPTVQDVSTPYSAVDTTTTQIPYDDTVPNQSVPEGKEFMSQTITPLSATNILQIDIIFNYAQTGSTTSTIAALFQDSTAGALAAAGCTCAFGGSPQQIIFSYRMVAGTTSATTFKVRAGPASAETLTFNGSGGARRLGGVMASSIRIREYAP